MEKILHKKSSQEIIGCIEAQRGYCEKMGAPHFAPPDGECWRCGKNIYQSYERAGYTNETASTKLITGCPHCNISYCE